MQMTSKQLLDQLETFRSISIQLCVPPNLLSQFVAVRHFPELEPLTGAAPAPSARAT